MSSPGSFRAINHEIEDNFRKATLGSSSILVTEPRIRVDLDTITGTISVMKRSYTAKNNIIFSVNSTGSQISKIFRNADVRSGHQICLGFSKNPELLEMFPK